jgi:hypothetical protein
MIMADMDASKEGRAAKDGGILQLLREMEETRENERLISGAIEGPFFSSAVYGGKVRIGIEKALCKSASLIRPEEEKDSEGLDGSNDAENPGK